MPLETLYRVPGPKSIYELNWEEVASFLQTSDAVIVPMGQVAQHGPHLPLASDAIQAYEVSRRVVLELKRRGRDLLLGPLIPFGHSPTHYEFPGTVELEPETLALVIRDIGRSLRRQGFRRIALFCCGGGNWSAVENAAYHLWREDDVKLVVLGFFETMATAAKPFLEVGARGEHDGHAGELETSCVLAARPELVDMRKAQNVQTPVYREMSELPFPMFNFNELSRAIGLWSTRAISESGIWGNATLASADKGERILDSAAALLADHLEKYLYADGRTEERG